LFCIAQEKDTSNKEEKLKMIWIKQSRQL